MADWTNENVLRLIEIYRSKEIIWNPAIKNHFNKTLKNDVWKEIASELSDYIATAITSNDRKNKMFSINAAYRRGKMKIRKSVGTGSDVYKSSGFAFESMEFLKNKDDARQRRCTYCITSSRICIAFVVDLRGTFLIGLRDDISSLLVSSHVPSIKFPFTTESNIPFGV
ncbi:hypothetical protein QTP88_016957 [Uroleucon formosanum]